MIAKQFKSKFDQLVRDPVLRAWLLGRVTGTSSSPPEFVTHVPPYVSDRLPLSPETGRLETDAVIDDMPDDDAVLTLPGKSELLTPEDMRTFFEADDEDIEVYLARHRFAWLPLSPDLPPGWFAGLWRAWRETWMERDGWHWHPYTAAERVINVLDASRRLGAPASLSSFAADLAAHAPKIADRLEYFGEHDTSNHLANNGRGLYRLGCALDLPEARSIGFEILIQEAKRILYPGGTLREGSTHYHFLYLRNYLDAWLAAGRAGRDAEAAALYEIAKRMMAAAKSLMLPGGLALIGDISPDSPPAFLSGLERGEAPWTRTLEADDALAVRRLADTTPAADIDALTGDGWLRCDVGEWSALAPVPTEGWPFMPGHAHQDVGSAEIHFQGSPLFVDPGRGRYGETGDAALYRSAVVHGTLSIDGDDPYPNNKPYYSDIFRRRIAGGVESARSADGFFVRHDGYRRRGITALERRWRFADGAFSIKDRVGGQKRVVITRALVTPHEVRLDGDAALVDARFRVAAPGVCARLDPVTVWSAYGSGQPGTRIVFDDTVQLPWTGRIDIERVG